MYSGPKRNSLDQFWECNCKDPITNHDLPQIITTEDIRFAFFNSSSMSDIITKETVYFDSLTFKHFRYDFHCQV